MFASEAQKACFGKVVTFVNDMFREGVVAAEDSPFLSVMAGSAMTFVLVTPLGETDAVVTVRATVVSHATITHDLAMFLLQANVTTMFGAFGISPQGDIVLEHNMIGSTLSKEELAASVINIARVADDIDDEIVARWGGERALDRIDGLSKLMDFEGVNPVSH